MTSVSGGDVYDVLGGSPLVEGGGLGAWRDPSATGKDKVVGTVGFLVVVGLVVMWILYLVEDDESEGAKAIGNVIIWVAGLSASLSVVYHVVDLATAGYAGRKLDAGVAAAQQLLN